MLIVAGFTIGEVATAVIGEPLAVEPRAGVAVDLPGLAQ